MNSKDEVMANASKEENCLGYDLNYRNETPIWIARNNAECDVKQWNSIVAIFVRFIMSASARTSFHPPTIIW